MICAQQMDEYTLNYETLLCRVDYSGVTDPDFLNVKFLSYISISSNNYSNTLSNLYDHCQVTARSLAGRKAQSNGEVTFIFEHDF